MLHTVLVQVLVDSVTIKHANEARAVVRQALDRDTQPELVGYTIIDAVAADAVGGIDVKYRKTAHRHITERCAMISGMVGPCQLVKGHAGKHSFNGYRWATA